MEQTIQRRDLLKAGLAVSALATSASAQPMETVRVAFVGVGGRGTGLLRVVLKLPGVKVNALADINEANLARAQKVVTDAGQAKPEGYSRSETDFRRLCDRDDLDLVINATPWQWHTPISVAAMNAGKHTATEVPAALTVEECWQLVETSEKTGKHCTMLENDCYYREVLMILTMIRAGLLGEPLYAEAGYLHDLRTVKFNTVPHGEPWRLEHTVKRNGNLYPTHPMGPLAWWMDINRGDRLSHLVSMSSKPSAMKAFAIREFGADDYRAKTDYKLGDVNVTLLKTERGRTITLWFNTNSPRVKEHLLRIQGSKGAFSSLMDKIFIEGRSNRGDTENWRGRHDWEETAEYRKEYESALWKVKGDDSRGSGHGGGDYMEMYRLIKNLREGRPPDIDVYDAAAWSVISPLSEASVADRSQPMEVPDFTRGKWKIRAPIDPDQIV
ncbi:MAG: Gfo/Idh/MocA family oxidoreductase [Bryobacteraceae bacterium]|nr:Gfo/Idh/MocA family oxidoreductase [Bryobacteraceae bacterium]